MSIVGKMVTVELGEIWNSQHGPVHVLSQQLSGSTEESQDRSCPG